MADKLLPNLKYIHVLRHGLDMAFSSNINQLKNWGFKYNIFLTGLESEDEIAVKQLDYWILSTKEVLYKADKMPFRFYLLNYSDFCMNPKIEVANLLNFLSIQTDKKLMENLIQLPRFTSTNQRYKQHDSSIFRIDQLDFVNKMGFEI